MNNPTNVHSAAYVEMKLHTVPWLQISNDEFVAVDQEVGEGWEEIIETLDDEEPTDIPSLGNVSVIAYRHELEGERYAVLRVAFNDGTVKLYRKDGYWDSYDNLDWDGEFYEVVETTQLVKVYLPERK